MNLDIEIECLDIPNDIKQKFFEEFNNRLDLLNNSNEIEHTICRSLTCVLYNKPTDMLKEKYKKIKKEEEYKKCNICFEQFKENQYKRDIKCGHLFHKKCIDKWINKYHKVNCPVCRENIFATVHQQTSSQTLHQ